MGFGCCRSFTNKGGSDKRFIISAVDYATRWPVAWATKNPLGATVQRFIVSEIAAKFGIPETIVTDGGKIWCPKLLTTTLS